MTHPGRSVLTHRVRLNVLLVEDRQDDVALVKRALEKGGFDIVLTVAETEDAYMTGLAAGPDVIVSDYHLPAFSGERALELANVLAPDLPFIVVSGSLGEDLCADIVKRGACQCLLKAGLARLPAVIKSAVAQRRHVKRENR